jgi:hypothetical protein
MRVLNRHTLSGGNEGPENKRLKSAQERHLKPFSVISNKAPATGCQSATRSVESRPEK